MDPVSLVFYACVCGVLGLAGPKLGAAPVRLGIGALVGIVAVTALPHVKTVLGLTEAYATLSP